MTPKTKCRFCGAEVTQTFVDLGMSPLCESYVSLDQMNQMEPFYPLHVKVCSDCFLVQLEEYVAHEDIFSDYAYFSSYSDSWLAHARAYTDKMIEQYSLYKEIFVDDLAINEGYLLQYFVNRNIPVLGIEPAANVAVVAEEKGVPTLVKFFGRELAMELAEEGRKADLILGNNVLAQVPDLNSFVAGMKILLKPAGLITLEFPHLLRLVAENQFDTIYHEHFSYFSLLTTDHIFQAHGMKIFDVEEISTHGGSLRVYGCHQEDGSKPVSSKVTALLEREKVAGCGQLEYYASFAEQVEKTKYQLLEFLIQAKKSGKTIAGYGAPGKGNTLLNYCGIRTDFIDYTVDRSPHKQGKFLPGTHIPIYHPDRITETRPDYVFILPWNLKNEIMQQMAHIREWGGQFFVPIPSPTVFP
ncbi:MAG: class I SAM-dependent methyltransferase [Acidobacteriota bacterium]